MSKTGFSLIKTIIIMVIVLVFGFVLYISFPFIYLAIFGPQQQIKGNSMLPNYENDKFVQTQNIVDLNRGDVVIFSHDINGIPQDLTKRIIGLPGETIKISGGFVFINDELLSEPYLSSGVTTNSFGSFITENQSVLIPDGSYFLMGDNRPHSTDSRDWGFITRENILKKTN